MKINQFVAGNTVSFFKNNFVKKWKLLNYDDSNTPLFFFGFVGTENIFESHNSWKVIFPSCPTDLPNFRVLKNYKNTILLIDSELPNGFYLPDDVIVKNIVLEIKDYSKFKPTVLGNKVYYYSGFKNGWLPNPKNFIKDIQSRIDYEIITTEHSNIADYYNIDYLIENYYNKSFISLNFTHEFIGHSGGMTTCRELGLMGRKTITGYNSYSYSCLIKTDCSIESIVGAINTESKKINTMQDSINAHNYNLDHLDINYMLSNY